MAAMFGAEFEDLRYEANLSVLVPFPKNKEWCDCNWHWGRGVWNTLLDVAKGRRTSFYSQGAGPRGLCYKWKGAAGNTPSAICLPVVIMLEDELACQPALKALRLAAATIPSKNASFFVENVTRLVSGIDWNVLLLLLTDDRSDTRWRTNSSKYPGSISSSILAFSAIFFESQRQIPRREVSTSFPSFRSQSRKWTLRGC